MIFNVLSQWLILFKHHIQMDNTEGKHPSLSWGRAYLSTNDMINRPGSAMKNFIEKKGGEVALTPATHNFDKKRMVSLWSHKAPWALDRFRSLWNQLPIDHLLMEPDGLPETTSVCAKCQVGMPCSVRSPLPIN